MSMRTLRKRVRVLLGAAAAVSIAVIALAGSIGAAAPNDVADQAKAKHYKGTRAYVVDKATGAVRLPTQQEVDEVVANLSAFGQRPTDSLQETTHSTGAVVVDLDGGFNGVMLARPNADGSWETKCVFTLEEGAEFLGLVEDDSIR